MTIEQVAGAGLMLLFLADIFLTELMRDQCLVEDARVGFLRRDSRPLRSFPDVAYLPRHDLPAIEHHRAGWLIVMNDPALSRDVYPRLEGRPRSTLPDRGVITFEHRLRADPDMRHVGCGQYRRRRIWHRNRDLADE